MITAIPNQPVSFLPSMTKGCACDNGPSSFIAPSDEMRFQVGYQQGFDEPNLIEPDVTEWSWPPATWQTSAGQVCVKEDNLGNAITTAFTPVVGTAYRIIITANITGTFAIDVGGAQLFISGSGSHDLFFIASTTDGIEIYPYTTESRGCVLSDVSIFELDADLGVSLMDGDADLFTITYADNPEYFSFVNGGVNVTIPMADAELSVGLCFHVAMIDNVDESTLTSQLFKVVADDDCGYLSLRGCNDYEGMGFAVPFAPRARIPATLATQRFEYDVVEERHSNGRNYRPYGDRERQMTLGTDVINEHDHNYLSALVIMSHQYIDGLEVVMAADTYEPAYGDVWSASGAVQVQVKLKEEILRNVQCGPELEGCAPENDPICNVPNIVYTWDSNELTATITSNAGFVVDTIQVVVGAYDSGELEFPSVPGVLLFGPFPDGSEVVITVVNAIDPTCNHTETLTVPVVECLGIEMELGEDSSLIAISSVGGYTYRNANTGNTFVGVNSVTYTPGAGLFCVTADDGGEITTLIVEDLLSIEAEELGPITYLGITFSDIEALDLSFIDNLGILVVKDCVSLDTLDLTEVPSVFVLELENLPLITTVDLSVAASLQNLIVNDMLLTTLDLSDSPFLISAEATNNSVLVTVTPHASAAYTNAVFFNNALNATSVDAICNACNAGFAGGTLTINGGTNAAPTAASLANRTALASNGWTITTN